MVLGDQIPKYVNYTFESKKRNPIIADLFFKMGYMKRRYSILSKITNSTNVLFKVNKEHVTLK